MLKKQNRLKAKTAFKATYLNHDVISDNLITLYTGKLKDDLKYDTDCPTRVGFVVSKKIHKRAVKRNRIKRLMRESVRLILKNNELDTINKYQSFIFSAKDEIIEKSFSEVYSSILTLLNKVANKNL